MTRSRVWLTMGETWVSSPTTPSHDQFLFYHNHKITTAACVCSEKLMKVHLFMHGSLAEGVQWNSQSSRRHCGKGPILGFNFLLPQSYLLIILIICFRIYRHPTHSESKIVCFLVQWEVHGTATVMSALTNHP